MKIGINKKILENFLSYNKNTNKKNIIFSAFIIFLLILLYILLNYNTILYAYNSNKEVTRNIDDMKFVLGGEVVRNKTFGNRSFSYGNR